MSLSPFELPDRVHRAVESIPTGGINIRKSMHVMLKISIWANVGFYAAWTAWLFTLLPNPLAGTSLLVQGFSLWFLVKYADQLRIQFGMMDIQKPSRAQDRHTNPVTVILAIAGLPSLLGILLPFLQRSIDQDFLVDLDQDPRRELVTTLVHCFRVYRYDPTRGKAGEEKLLALVGEVDAALAFPGIGRLPALTPEHEDLLARLRCWPADPPPPGELREVTISVNEALGEALDVLGEDR